MMKQMILLWMGAILLPLSAQQLMPDTELKLELKQKQELTFRPEAKGERFYLTVDARLENETKQRIGSWFALGITLNDRILTYEDLVNYRGLDYTAHSGMKYPIFSRAHNIFRVVYSPDFTPFPEVSLPHMPIQLGRYPYRFIIDVTPYIKKDGDNKLVLANRMTIGGFPVFIKNIEISDEFEEADWSKMLPEIDLGALPGVTRPRTDWKTPFQWKKEADGTLSIGDFSLKTTFSIPEGKWLDFSKPKNSYYTIDRKVEAFDNYLRIADTVRNIGKEPLGLMIKYAVDGRNFKAEELRLNGFRQVGRSGFRAEQILNTENPSVFVNSAQNGIGLLAVDDGLRGNLVTGGKDGEEYYLMNRRLTIDPGKSYTTTVDVYPTRSRDYFEFVNAARRNWGVNFQLDNLVFAHGFSNYTKQRKNEDFVNFVRWHKPYYLGMDTQTYIAPNGQQIPEQNQEDYVWGSPLLMTERFRPLRETTLLLRDRFKAIDPDLKFIAYHNSYQIPSKDTARLYPDELWRDRNGDPVTYSRVKSQRILPTPDNKTGKAQFENFDNFYIANKIGLFWDESTGVDPLYSFHTPWDGFSGELDPETFKLKMKVTNIVLYTQAYQQKVIDTFAQAGLPVVCNFEPATWTVAKQGNILRFVEGHDPLSGNRTHFYTPATWGAADSELSENDIAKTMRTHLSNGSLFMYYSRKFEHDNNFIQAFYPITPLELYSGYVIGKEKIITMRSGTFSFGDDLPLIATIYDGNGFKTRTHDRYQSSNGETSIAVTLSDGEIAVINRK